MKVVPFSQRAPQRAPWLTLAALGTSLCLVLALTGCEQIAGIERRKFRGGDGGLGDGGIGDLKFPSQQTCDDFCEQVSEGCSAETSGVFAYKSMTTYCNALCRNLPLASDPENVDNTNSFECRRKEAENAFGQRGDMDEGAMSCRSASAGGAPYCGSNCEAYCQLFANICADTPTKPREDCLEKCAALASDDSLDADKSFSSNNADTVQCRLSHLGAAATAKATGSREATEDHCEHASIYVDKLTPCMTPTPRCSDYCAVTMSVCDKQGQEDLRQYETLQDCLNVCAKGLSISVADPDPMQHDKTEDTVACRRYHAYNALLFDRPYHCNHAGPGGDGHCSPICPAYCRLVKKTCAADFPKFFANEADCEARCLEIPAIAARPADKQKADFQYNVGLGQAGKNTIQCRLYHASKALGNQAECDSALGRPTPANVCVD